MTNELDKARFEFVQKLIAQILPLLNTSDFCAVLWSSRAFGYWSARSDFDINVIHAGNRDMGVKILHDGTMYDMSFVSRRTFNRITHSVSDTMLHLIPMGDVIDTSNGLSQVTFNERVNSLEWKECLLRKINIDVNRAIDPPSDAGGPAKALGFFLRQVYAYLLRETLSRHSVSDLRAELLRKKPKDIETLAFNVGGPLLMRDFQDVCMFQSKDVLTSERTEAIMKLFHRLVTRNTQPT